MSVDEEFATVDLVSKSNAETRGVDAFALSLIKAEKQARRLVTYLVYQHSWCGLSTIDSLKNALESSNKVYFRGLLRGWNALWPVPVEQLIGTEHTRLRARLDEAKQYRNKIFHGQLTGKELTRSAFEAFVKDIRRWCNALGAGAQAEVGYDGCGRDSFQKAHDAAALCARYKTPLANIAAYRDFIKKHMER